MTTPPATTRARFNKGVAAILVGCAVNHFGDRLLGVRIELFHGIQTFSFLWMLDMFVLPFIVGILVAVMFGLGGKWLCYFPPLIVRAISYFEISHLTGVPDGSSLLPLGWWGFFVILVIEASAFGGVIGEIMVKGTYGRRPRQMVYKDSFTEADEE
ncbi:MAG: hypothetical protein GC139_04395 [Sideroxydans sp.]|nr:hypothetical protein [Sideroxydans sp.]